MSSWVTSKLNYISLHNELKEKVLTCGANVKSNHQRCSIKKGALKDFAVLTRKQQDETPTQMFSCEFAKFLRKPLLKNNCELLLLKPDFQVDTALSS